MKHEQASGSYVGAILDIKLVALHTLYLVMCPSKEVALCQTRDSHSGNKADSIILFQAWKTIPLD